MGGSTGAVCSAPEVTHKRGASASAHLDKSLDKSSSAWFPLSDVWYGRLYQLKSGRIPCVLPRNRTDAGAYLLAVIPRPWMSRLLMQPLLPPLCEVPAGEYPDALWPDRRALYRVQQTLALLHHGATIGAAKLWYDRTKKRFYLLVSIEVELGVKLASFRGRVIDR